MRGREVTLWLDERWYDALSKQLKGETLEEHLENILDEMCNQLPQREYERISHELWAERQAEKEAREAARRFAVFHVTENGSSDYILAEEKLELLPTARRLRSYIRKPPDEAPHRFVETLLRTQRISQEEFNPYVSERLDNTGRVVGAYHIDLDSGDMEAVSIMDGWKRFRIRDVSTAAYFAMKKGIAAPDERWRIFLDRLEERTLNQEPESECLSGSRRLCAEDISFADEIIQNDNLLEFYMEVGSLVRQHTRSTQQHQSPHGARRDQQSAVGDNCFGTGAGEHRIHQPVNADIRCDDQNTAAKGTQNGQDQPFPFRPGPLQQPHHR